MEEGDGVVEVEVVGKAFEQNSPHEGVWRGGEGGEGLLGVFKVAQVGIGLHELGSGLGAGEAAMG